ncbi:hypothetical protein D3C78_1012730 [compost metagenome]
MHAESLSVSAAHGCTLAIQGVFDLQLGFRRQADLAKPANRCNLQGLADELRAANVLFR